MKRVASLLITLVIVTTLTTACSIGPATASQTIDRCALPESALIEGDSLHLEGPLEGDGTAGIPCALKQMKASKNLREKLGDKTTIKWGEAKENGTTYQWSWPTTETMKLRIYAEETKADMTLPDPPLLEKAVECGVGTSSEDDGMVLNLDGEGTDDRNVRNGFKAPDYKVSTEELVCMLNALGTPESIISKMERTRSLDGVQEDSAGGYDYSWTYHPDNGLDIIVEHSPR